uniref:Putative ovule protein n=1 Tax=Solanum chacoense TaxID=4108 RepID=A0A0V0GKU3_SOLCH
MKIRPSLWPQYQASGRAYLPSTYFTMSSNEKEMFYEVLQNAKFPHGYASNISRWICKRKISGLKTYDCHVIMQELLPLAL